MVEEIKTIEERKNKLLVMGQKQGYVTYEQLAEQLLEEPLNEQQAQELVEEIYQEIKAQSININKEDIQLIDEESLLNDYLNKNEKNNLDTENIGRIALIRFKNDYDGLKFYSKNYFSVPLNDGKKGKPNMILGQILIDFIKKNQI